MSKGWLVVAWVGVGLCACGFDRTVAVVEPQQGNVTFKDIPVTLNRDVDILFVIDDSPSMADKQANLEANFHRFIEVLETIDGGLPNVHIAVATTDLGTKGADDSLPGQYTISGDGGKCMGYGKDGRFQTNLATVQGHYLIDTLNDDGTRTKNYTGNLVDVFSQMASVGQAGCGFEQPLEAVHRALDNNPTNNGFLRFNALLAVVILSDEDDCSLAHSSMLGADTSLGPLASFRCTRFGVECDTGGVDPAQMNQAGMKYDCKSNDTKQYLTDVGRYVDFVKGLKADPKNVIVADIGAPPSPVTTELVGPAGGQVSSLAHSCSYVDSTNTLEVGDPTVRVNQFLQGFPDRNTFQDICQQDLSGGLAQLGELLKEVIGDPCITGQLVDVDPTTDGGQYECQVSDIEYWQTPDEKEVPVAACDNDADPASSSALPCWHVISDPQHCLVGSHLELKIERAIPPPTGTHVVAYCVSQ
jgi:hypothetical protein